MAALRQPRRGCTASWRTTPTPASWSRPSTRICVKSPRSPRRPTPHEMTATPPWRGGLFTLSPRGKGRDLPRRTDLDCSLGVGETSLRTVDSELGSALGSWQPPQERLAPTEVASVSVTVQHTHTGSTWSDPGGCLPWEGQVPGMEREG